MLDILEFSSKGSLGKTVSGNMDISCHDLRLHILESLKLDLIFLLSERNNVFLIRIGGLRDLVFFVCVEVVVVVLRD